MGDSKLFPKRIGRRDLEALLEREHGIRKFRVEIDHDEKPTDYSVEIKVFDQFKRLAKTLDVDQPQYSEDLGDRGCKRHFYGFHYKGWSVRYYLSQTESPKVEPFR
jgi:hypothetical protein